jgi:HEAT repeat protein
MVDANIETLMTDLAGEDGMARVLAREALVLIGEAAVGRLVQALQDKREWLRWEAAKTLSKIGSPAATRALIGALEDRMFDVRWLSAEGLIAVGRDALPPLLHALLARADSAWFREGAHHVLHGIDDRGARKIIAPVIAALESANPGIGVPLATEAALDALGHGGIH